MGTREWSQTSCQQTRGEHRQHHQNRHWLAPPCELFQQKGGEDRPQRTAEAHRPRGSRKAVWGCQPKELISRSQFCTYQKNYRGTINVPSHIHSARLQLHRGSANAMGCFKAFCTLLQVHHYPTLPFSAIYPRYIHLLQQFNFVLHLAMTVFTPHRAGPLDKHDTCMNTSAIQISTQKVD